MVSFPSVSSHMRKCKFPDQFYEEVTREKKWVESGFQEFPDDPL